MESATSFLQVVGDTIPTVLGWIGTTINSLLDSTGELNALLGLFCVSVVISAIMLGVKMIRSFVWGA